MVVVRLHERALECRMLTGLPQNVGRVICMPQVKLTESDELPCSLTRIQFPLKLAFAVTINKSQGQTLSTVGLCLPQAVFTHGQLCVALSRVSKLEDLHCLIQPCTRGSKSDHTQTINVVCQEVL